MGGLLGGKKQSRVDPESVRVTFDDVAGIDEVENEINEIVDFLKDPGKYRRLGARAPKGVLLAGAPGTGQSASAHQAIVVTRMRYRARSATVPWPRDEAVVIRSSRRTTGPSSSRRSRR